MNPEAYREMAATEAQHWWFTGRRRILASILESLNIPKNARILEIGSGTGGNLEMLTAFGAVYGLEMDKVACELTKNKYGNQFSIYQGACPDNMPDFGQKFDLICFFDVLEHIENDEQALNGVQELLNENGQIILTVPAYRWLWSIHDEFLHHKRRYNVKNLKHLITATEFKITRLTYFNSLLFPLAAIVRLKDIVTQKKTATGTNTPPVMINNLLKRIFSLECFWLKKFNFCFGVSILCILSSK